MTLHVWKEFLIFSLIHNRSKEQNSWNCQKAFTAAHFPLETPSFQSFSPPSPAHSAQPQRPHGIPARAKDLLTPDGECAKGPDRETKQRWALSRGTDVSVTSGQLVWPDRRTTMVPESQVTLPSQAYALCRIPLALVELLSRNQDTSLRSSSASQHCPHMWSDPRCWPNGFHCPLNQV